MLLKRRLILLQINNHSPKSERWIKYKISQSADCERYHFDPFSKILDFIQIIGDSTEYWLLFQKSYSLR